MNGSTRNFGQPIRTGSYAITTLDDARAMTFNNLPAAAAGLTTPASSSSAAGSSSSSSRAVRA